MGVRDIYGGGQYIKAAELADNDVEVTISSVVMEDSFGKEQYVLVFGEGDSARKLGLNKTNVLVCADNFGDGDSAAELTQKWAGRSIVLFAIDTQTPEGSPTKGVRIRVPKAVRTLGGPPSATPTQAATPAAPATLAETPV